MLIEEPFKSLTIARKELCNSFAIARKEPFKSLGSLKKAPGSTGTDGLTIDFTDSFLSIRVIRAIPGWHLPWVET